MSTAFFQVKKWEVRTIRIMYIYIYIYIYIFINIYIYIYIFIYIVHIHHIGPYMVPLFLGRELLFSMGRCRTPAFPAQAKLPPIRRSQRGAAQCGM